jgi:hypothetical protein
MLDSLDEFPRDYLVRKHNNNKIILHTSNTGICDINKYAKRSLEIDNDAKRRSKDEAISIHIITDKLNTRLNILYEMQICAFYGKPDFIIRLGKKLYIMVSTTRAVCHTGTSRNGTPSKYKSRGFTQQEADRLVRKKLTGLSICRNNLECLIYEVIEDDHLVRPVLHILAPNKLNAMMCMKSYKDLLVENKLDLAEIKVIISCVENHRDVL